MNTLEHTSNPAVRKITDLKIVSIVMGRGRREK
jgi:hypothetical protein